MMKLPPELKRTSNPADARFSAAQAFVERPYMNVPHFAKLQFMKAARVRLQPYIRTFAAARAAVPDGIGWLASQSLFRTRGAADVLGLTSHGLTWFAITA